MTLAPGRALRLFADGASSSDSARQQRSDFREALRRWILEVAHYFAICVERKHERVTLDRWLQKVRQAHHDFPQKRPSQQSIQRAVAAIDDRHPENVPAV